MTKTPRRSMDELIRLYGQDEVERAGKFAEKNGARNTLQYITKTLASWHPNGRTDQSANGARQPKKLRCDSCNRQTWLADLVVRLGFAICTGSGGCLVIPQDTLEQDDGTWPMTAPARILGEGGS